MITHTTRLGLLLLALTAVKAPAAATAQVHAPSVQGAFGITLLQPGGNLENEGFIRREGGSDDDPTTSWSKSDHDFFHSIVAVAHRDVGLIRNIYGFRYYPTDDRSGAACGSDFDQVVATLRTRYPSFQSREIPPPAGRTKQVYLAQRFISNRWPEGRHIAVSCWVGDSSKSPSLTVSYRLSLEENQQQQRRAEAARNRRLTEEARDRGLRPEDF